MVEDDQDSQCNAKVVKFVSAGHGRERRMDGVVTENKEEMVSL